MKLSSTLKLAIVLGTTLGVVGFAQPAYADDTDLDSVSNAIESSAPNAGDNNYDTYEDQYQNDVATIQNPNDVQSPGSFVTLEISGPNPGYEFNGTDWQIKKFTAVDVATLPTQPEGKIFPLGLFQIELCKNSNYDRVSVSDSDAVNQNYCPSLNYCYGGAEYCYPSYESPQIQSQINTDTPITLEELSEWIDPCETVSLRLLFDRVLDTSNWTLYKYVDSTGSYLDYTDKVTVSTENIGFLRTVISWNLTDNADGDDNPATGFITDPAGPAVPQTVAVSNPIITTASVVRPTALANTGANGIVIIAAGIIFIAAGAVLLPRKN